MLSNTKRNVIIGNSAAGLSALETLRRNDPNCEITIISREKGPAYSLVLLPYFICRRIDKSSLEITTDEYYRNLRTNTIFGKEAVEINIENQHILLDDGSRVPYDNLIISTGALPNGLGIEGPHMVPIKSLRTLEDAFEIKALLENARKILVIGAGLINLKLISLLRNEGFEFTVVEMADRVLINMLDQTTSAVIERKIQESGVNLYKGCILTRMRRENKGEIFAVLNNELEIETNAVIFNTGISPNVDFIKSSGILIDRGIIIDQYATTNIPNIYAAGDVVTVQERISGEYMTIGNWFNAVEQGKVAAYSILGKNQKYEGCLNINVTDLFGFTVISFGDFNGMSKNSNSIVWSDSARNYYRKIVVNEDKVIGVIFLNENKLGGIYKSFLGRKLSEPKFPVFAKNFGNVLFGQIINYSKIKGIDRCLI